MSCATSSGKCSVPASSSTVVRGWAPDTTSGASSCSPESSVTPTARPSRTSIELTAEAVRIVAPAASARGYVTAWRPGDVMAVGPLHGTHEPPFYVCGSDQWVAGYMEGRRAHGPRRGLAGARPRAARVPGRGLIELT